MSPVRLIPQCQLPAWRCRLAVCLALASSAWNAQADAPLPHPSNITVQSEDGRFRVRARPKGPTIAFDAHGRQRWTVPGWHAQFFVPNNGTDLVVVYDGLNLLPLDFSDELSLLTVWREGKVYRRFTASRLIPDRNMLEATSSHYFWGHVMGLNQKNQIVVHRADGVQILIDYEADTLMSEGRWRSQLEE